MGYLHLKQSDTRETQWWDIDDLYGVGMRHYLRIGSFVDIEVNERNKDDSMKSFPDAKDDHENGQKPEWDLECQLKIRNNQTISTLPGENIKTNRFFRLKDGN